MVRYRGATVLLSAVSNCGAPTCSLAMCWLAFCRLALLLQVGGSFCQAEQGPKVLHHDNIHHPAPLAEVPTDLQDEQSAGHLCAMDLVACSIDVKVDPGLCDDSACCTSTYGCHQCHMLLEVLSRAASSTPRACASCAHDLVLGGPQQLPALCASLLQSAILQATCQDKHDLGGHSFDCLLLFRQSNYLTPCTASTPASLGLRLWVSSQAGP